MSTATAAEQTAHWLQRNGVQRGRRIEDDRALDDIAVCTILGISKPTLVRYRKRYGLPGPHFRIGQRPFTWRSELNTWIAGREAAGVEFRLPVHEKGDAESDHSNS